MQSPSMPQARAWPTTRITLLQRVGDQLDRGSWDRFERVYGPLIHRYCVRRGVQDADAADIVQDVMLQVSRGIGSFRYDAERGRFRNWLGTLTHRAMLKHMAKWRRATVAFEEASVGWSPCLQACPHALDEGWVEAFNAYVFEESLKRLQLSFSEEEWRAFHGTFIENRPANEVALDLSRPVGWVYQAKSRVIRQVKNEILYLAEDSVLLTLQPGG